MTTTFDPTFLRGTAAQRPATAEPDTLYVAEDTGAVSKFTDGTWQSIAPGSGTIRAAELFDLPTGAFAQSYKRSNGNGNAALITSARLFLVAFPVNAGDIVTSVTFEAGSTAAATATHCWGGIWSAARALLGVSADDTAASPWAANAFKTFTLTAPYPVVAADVTARFLYAGVVVVGGTMPSIRGLVTSGGHSGAVPILCGDSTAGLTDPASAPNPAAAISAANTLPYVYAS